MYKPLPAYISIGPSNIHGAGLFAVEDIPEEVVMGITHVYDQEFEDDYVRTPLGGFLTHSENPNCKLIDKDDYKRLTAIKHIDAGTELTVNHPICKVR